MLKKIIISMLVLCCHSAWADVSLEPLLNKVILQLHATAWVTTKTALVNVNVNAAVNDQGLDKVQTDVLQKLTQLSNAGEWHIVSFDRQQDKSGLESVQITAQARLPQTALSNLRSTAKAISKPGLTFTIDSVQFTPSDEELQLANIQLRNNLYAQAKAEMDMLNKIYPDQKFYLHEVNFMMTPMPLMNAYRAKNEMMVAAAVPQPTQPLSVGNKQEMQAVVTIASLPEAVLARMNTLKQ